MISPPSAVSYIIVNPARGCPRAIHRTRQSFAHYWKKHKRTLDIGHRGLGNSHHTPDELKPSAAENTIASLKRAGAHVSVYSGPPSACVRVCPVSWPGS